MNRTITLTFQYYRLILLYNIAFTIIILFLQFFSGINDLASFFFAKLCGLVCAAGLYHYSAGKTYFYFRNAGLQIRRLFVYTIIIDSCIFVIATTLIILSRHAFVSFKS